MANTSTNIHVQERSGLVEVGSSYSKDVEGKEFIFDSEGENYGECVLCMILWDTIKNPILLDCG